MMTFTLTQPVSLVCTKRPIPFVRWLATYFEVLEYEQQMIGIPGVGVYRLITSSGNTELEVGIHAPINAITSRRWKMPEQGF
jgi:hypothetical protein